MPTTRLQKRRFLALAGLATLMAFLPTTRGSEPPPTNRLIVAVTGLKNTHGNVVVSLFRGSDGFPGDGEKALASRIVPAKDVAIETNEKVLRIPFEGLAPGEYAVALFHDQNGNGKLDSRWGIPTEGFGFSNNPKLRWSAPKYREAQFTFAGNGDGDRGETVTVPLRYLSGRH